MANTEVKNHGSGTSVSGAAVGNGADDYGAAVRFGRVGGVRGERWHVLRVAADRAGDFVRVERERDRIRGEAEGEQER